jgi:hypothetical protein
LFNIRRDECSCKRGYVGIKCNQKCEFYCGNGYCIDRGYSIDFASYLRFKVSLDNSPGFFVPSEDGYMNWIHCECYNGFSGKSCNLYAADWLRIIKTTINWAIFPLIYIILTLYHFL